MRSWWGAGAEAYVPASIWAGFWVFFHCFFRLLERILKNVGFFWQICLSAAKEYKDPSRCKTWTPCGRVFQSLISPRNEQLTIIVSFLSASLLPNSNFSLRQHTPASLSHSRKKLVPQSFWRLTTPARHGFIRAHKEHNKCKNKQTRQRARRVRNF